MTNSKVRQSSDAGRGSRKKDPDLSRDCDPSYISEINFLELSFG
jgi:hypothetical protein